MKTSTNKDKRTSKIVVQMGFQAVASVRNETVQDSRSTPTARAIERKGFPIAKAQDLA